MNDREQIAWLYRRVGFGLEPGQLDALAAKGVPAVLDELIDPSGHGVAAARDPWQGLDLGPFEPGKVGKYLGQVVAPWLQAMITTTRPLHEWLRWFWHGHFVSTIRVVKQPELMITQLRLLGTEGLGDFRTLLRAVSIDAAMLLYLDGATNKKGAVNENYGRELLELFALGIGNYDERAVRAGAEALTGWNVQRRTGEVSFAPGQHDDTPHDYLGRSGVHDLDSVVDAVVGHDACARFIVTELGHAILGPDADTGVLSRLASGFRDGGLQILPLVRAILEAGLDGASGPSVRAPVPWFAAATRSTGAPVDKVLSNAAGGLVAAGQLPLDAPNVAGWPGGRAWLSSSATVARFNMASAISELAPKDGAAKRAIADGDLAGLATTLGCPDGFGSATTKAIGDVRKAGASSALTVALAAPELVLA